MGFDYLDSQIIYMILSCTVESALALEIMLSLPLSYRENPTLCYGVSGEWIELGAKVFLYSLYSWLGSLLHFGILWAFDFSFWVFLPFPCK